MLPFHRTFFLPENIILKIQKLMRLPEGDLRQVLRIRRVSSLAYLMQEGPKGNK